MESECGGGWVIVPMVVGRRNRQIVLMTDWIMKHGGIRYASKRVAREAAIDVLRICGFDNLPEQEPA